MREIEGNNDSQMRGDAPHILALIPNIRSLFDPQNTTLF